MTESPFQPNPSAAASPFDKIDFKLNWARSDIEQRFGFKGGQFTGFNRFFTLLIGILCTIAFFAILIFAIKPRPELAPLAAMFLDRGPTQYVAMLLFFWSLAIIVVKLFKIGFQRRALTLAAVPQQPEFVVTPDTAQSVLHRLHDLVDSTGHFILLNRIERALSNLKNIGRVSDVASLLAVQADHDEERVASSYSLVNGFVWAIPVLGFIGTVLGLSQAIGAFGVTLQAGGDINSIKESLQSVIGGLATAFETTLVALVAALIVQLALTYVRSRESEFLDECNDYCHSQVTSRLRLTAQPASANLED